MPDALVIGKEKQFVLLDWPADGGSELIATKLGDHVGIENVSGVEDTIANKIKPGAVKLVGALLENGVDHASRAPSIFRGKRV